MEKLSYKPETPFKQEEGLVYNLFQDGWNKGIPVMANDVWIQINIDQHSFSKELRDKIADIIVKSLNQEFLSESHGK